MFFISTLTKLSALPHTIFLHPAQDVTAHITKGAEKLAENHRLSRLSTVVSGLGWNHPPGPAGRHRMTLKWKFQPPQLAQGCWPEGWTGAW